MTTNTDGTTKQITYGGCGCAGGEVVTVQDESGRRQQTTAGALGRVVTVKTFYLPQQGGGVYSTTTNSYNVRDQVTRVLVQQGSSGTGRETLTTYDGYGRLQSTKAPAQTATTEYTYYDDDTLKTVKDGRRATKTLTYNNRHLPTIVDYAAPAGISVPAQETFGYDAAGNRTSMSGGTGTHTYAYDTLSRMISETQQFSGLAGSFTLSYEYTTGDLLKKVTDPTEASVSYDYDASGRLGSVSGSPYGGVTQYASSMQYRAWGALKHAGYGNGHTLDLQSNARGQVSRYDVSGVASLEYQYATATDENDGRPKFVRDLSTANSIFDRAYKYDHVGRLTETLSGSEARGANLEDGPYHETYAYDAWGGTTQRTRRAWDVYVSDQTSADPTTGRVPGFTYDADGRETQNDAGRGYTYDAAGRLSVTTQTTSRPNPNPHVTTPITTQRTSTETYDGDGVGVRQATAAATTYYLRSSALGGRIIAELDPQGSRQNSYAGGEKMVQRTF